jgi:hypothetical protein
MFLTPNPNWKITTSKGWYKNVPAGRNQISSWMAESAKKIGIDPKKIKITNHSVRASAVSNLAKQGVGEQQLIKVTGHSNSQSIRPYLQMDQEHHKKIVDIMRNKAEPTISTSTTNLQNSLTQTSLDGQSIVYNKCTFNINT